MGGRRKKGSWLGVSVEGLMKEDLLIDGGGVRNTEDSITQRDIGVSIAEAQ